MKERNGSKKLSFQEKSLEEKSPTKNKITSKMRNHIKKDLPKSEIDVNKYLKDIKNKLEKNINDKLGECNDEKGVKSILRNIHKIIKKENPPQEKSILDLDFPIFSESKSPKKTANTSFSPKKVREKRNSLDLIAQKMCGNKMKLTNNVEKLKPSFYSLSSDEEDRYEEAIKGLKKDDQEKFYPVPDGGLKYSDKKAFKMEQIRISKEEKMNKLMLDKPVLFDCPPQIKKNIAGIKPLYLRYKEVVVKKQEKIMKLRQETSANLETSSKIEFTMNPNKTSEYLFTELNDGKTRKEKFEEWIDRSQAWEQRKNQKIIAMKERKETEEIEELSRQRYTCTSKSQILKTEYLEKDFNERLLTSEKMKKEKQRRLSEKYDYDHTPKTNVVLPKYLQKVAGRVNSMTSLFSDKSKVLKDKSTEEGDKKKNDFIVKEIRKRNRPNSLVKVVDEINHRNMFVSMFHGTIMNNALKNFRANKVFYEKKYENIVKALEKDKKDKSASKLNLSYSIK